jgi:hypothetical protein
MRRTVHLACAAILFIMSFAAISVFFGAVDLHLSALLGPDCASSSGFGCFGEISCNPRTDPDEDSSPRETNSLFAPCQEPSAHAAQDGSQVSGAGG